MNGLELCLFGGEGSVIRGYTDKKGNETWSAFDFVNVVCQKPPKHNYGRVTFNRLYDNPEFLDIRTACAVGPSTSERGHRDTKYLTLKGLLRVLAILPGKVAANYRTLITDTIMRVIAGDRSLIQVIEANAESKGPTQQAFRDTLGHEPADDTLEHLSGMKRKQAELDYGRNQLTHVTTKIDMLTKARHEGSITDFEHNRLKRFTLFEYFPAINVNEHVPSMDPLFIFWSAIINYVSADVSTKQLRSCYSIAITFESVQNAYKHFFTPYVGYLTTTTERVNIIDASLIPNPQHKPHEVRLQQLMLAQKKREMTIYSHGALLKTAREVFHGAIQTSSSMTPKHSYTFSLSILKEHLIDNLPYQAIGYDEGVCLSVPIPYRIV